MKRLLSFAAAAFIATSAFAQTAPSSDQANAEVLRALLEEIRTLRMTLLKLNANELRGQLLVERFKAQQQIVRELQKEVEQWSDNRMFADAEPMDDYMNDIEARYKAETDPERKKQMEREMEGFKRRREMELRHREQMRLRYQRLEMRLAEETSKLQAIEEELTKLEAELTKT